MHVRDATVGPLSGTTPVSAALTSMAVVRHAQRVRHDLRVHRPRPLPDLGAGDEDSRTAFGQRQRRLRRQLDLAAAGEARAMEEQRQPDPAVACRPVSRRRRCEVGALDRLAQHLQRAAVLAKPLAGRGRVARPQGVDLAHAHRIEAERLGDAVHVRLRPRTASAARRTRGTRRWAACWSSPRGRGSGRDRSDRGRSRG